MTEKPIRTLRQKIWFWMKCAWAAAFLFNLSCAILAPPFFGEKYIFTFLFLAMIALPIILEKIKLGWLADLLADLSIWS